MEIQLSDEEAVELVAILDGALGELASEIAATDNAFFRADLVKRRDLLRAVHARLSSS